MNNFKTCNINLRITKNYKLLWRVRIPATKLLSSARTNDRESYYTG